MIDGDLTLERCTRHEGCTIVTIERVATLTERHVDDHLAYEQPPPDPDAVRRAVELRSNLLDVPGLMTELDEICLAIRARWPDPPAAEAA